MPETFTTRPQLAGTFGMVASTHWLASAAGMAVLEKGGNAFDAAVATGLVLQVVEPHLNGPGGEVPVIGFSAAAGGVFVLDGQGPAPAAATLDVFGALGLDLVPGTGLLAACVPAAFGTWMLLLERYGTLRLRDVMEYAIGYAGNGYPMLGTASAAVTAVADTFREHWPSSAAVYLPGGSAPAAGARFANPDLAAAYGRLLDEAEAASADRLAQIEAARRVFYEGFVAAAIAEFLARAEVMDVTGRRHRGLLTGDDLAAWRASAEAPVTLDYHGLTVCKTGPWGQGPVFLQQLALLDGFDLAAMGPGSADFIHTVIECAKLAFADREAWYGDPRGTDVPLAELLSPSYAAERRRLVGREASGGLVPARPVARSRGCRGTRPPGLATAPEATGRARRARARALARRTAGIAATARASRWPARGRTRWRPSWGRETPAIWTWRTRSATWCPPRRAAAGCRARRSFPGSGSAWALARRCSRSPPAWPARSRPAGGRGRRCRRRWRCATASRTSRSARPAGTSRTSGRSRSSSTTCCSA